MNSHWSGQRGIRERSNKNIKNDCTKKFYVSPFMDLNSRYFFRITNPGENLSVLINQEDKDGKLLFASQDGSRTDFNTKNLIFSYLKHPLMLSLIHI